MPARPSFLRMMTPLIVALAIAMPACVGAFKLAWPDEPGWRLAVPSIVASLLILAWMSIVLRKRWVAPVRNLTDVADKMGAGDWTARAVATGADDPKAFADSLNAVAKAAQEQLSTLDHQRSDLRQLVDSLPDPILLSDADERLILINAPASRLLALSQAEATGKKFVHVVNDMYILQLFEALAQTNDPQQREIRITRGNQRSSFQAMGTRTKAGGRLIVLRNVSTMASAIQMKTDFVANASHELRTPIAAIKIAFETMRDVLDDDREQVQKCAGIIEGHLRRLEEMLTDLLDLSRVETADLRPQVDRVTSGELFAPVRDTFATQAAKKNVDLVFESEDSLAFQSDRRLLDLILKNLVENALKFTPADGRVTVRVSATKPSIARWPAAGNVGGAPASETAATASEAEAAETESEFARSKRKTGRTIWLSVTDTGIGIPAEHLERVFERFYQVEPSRGGGVSRGTGLGLAIVKHAVHALDGKVSLHSSPGEGTMVVCAVSDQV